LKLVSADELATKAGGPLARVPDDDDDAGVGPLGRAARSAPPIGLNPEVEDEATGANPADLKPEGLEGLRGASPSSREGSTLWLGGTEEESFVHPAAGFFSPPPSVLDGSDLPGTDDGRASRLIPEARAMRSSSLASRLRSFSSFASDECPVALRACFASAARFAWWCAYDRSCSSN